MEGMNASARRLKALLTNLGAECAQSVAPARCHLGNTALAMSVLTLQGLRTRRARWLKGPRSRHRWPYAPSKAAKVSTQEMIDQVVIAGNAIGGATLRTGNPGSL